MPRVRYTLSITVLTEKSRMFGKTCFALALIWLALPALAAPPSVLTPPAPLENIRQSGFVYCVNDVLNTFNPQMARSGVTIDTLAAQLYDRLLDVDPYTYRLMPELAQRWEVLDNGSTYRFYLRRDVPFQHTALFSPTRNMNADDVIFSFQRMLDKKHPYHDVNGGEYPYFDSLQFADSVQSIRKLGEYSIEIRLNSPDASFLWHLATHYAPVLSAEYAQRLANEDKKELLDREPVGTGLICSMNTATGNISD